MKTYLVSYSQGEILITKIIKAKSEKNAIEIFIEAYDQYDITNNEVEIIECEEFNANIEKVFKKIKEMHSLNK